MVLRWVILVLLAQVILINISAALYAYRLTHFYKDAALSNSQRGDNIFSKTVKLFTGPRYPRTAISSWPVFSYQVVKWRTRDGHIIESWYHKTDSIAGGTVILFHGTGGAKDHLLREATAFLEMGYHIMMVDFRGYGNSSGNSTTWSIRESEEVKLAYEYARQIGEKKIFLWGASMGAVTIAKAIYDYQINVAGIILEAPFASIQSHLGARARIIGFPVQPFAFLTTFWLGVEGGFNGLGAQTSKYAGKIHCPVLLQWGSRDNYVLKQEINSVFKGVASKAKKLVVYEDAGHESLLGRDPVKWQNEIKKFLEICR